MADDVIVQRMNEMQAELDALRAEVRRLRGDDPAQAPAGASPSRRQLLSRGAIAAGAGAIGAALAARPVTAAGIDPVELGVANTSTGSTQVSTSGSVADALYGEATTNAANSNAWGVRGETASPNGFGVYGKNRAATGTRPVGVKGVAATATGVGVEGAVDAPSGNIGEPVGVYGHVEGLPNATGVRGEVTSTDSEAAGVAGVAQDRGWGVIGVSGPLDESGGGVLGICDTGPGRGVSAVHQAGGVALEAQSPSGLGAVIGGGTAAVRLGASSGVPTARTEAHSFGELYVDQQTRHLWYCTSTGTPGTWVKLSAPQSPPQSAFPPLLTPVTPFRVYDSRFTDGPLLLSATSRLVSVRHSIDIETGELLVTDAVPPGATAVTFNLTVFETVGGGFVAATPGSATTFGTASVNWSGPNQVVGNATLVTLDGARRMRIFIGGSTGARVGFTVDVTGYLL